MCHMVSLGLPHLCHGPSVLLNGFTAAGLGLQLPK